MRKIDNLGRVVIPKELRKKHGLFEGSDVEFEDFGVGILVKSGSNLCRLCNDKLGEESTLSLCEKCINRVIRERGNLCIK